MSYWHTLEAALENLHEIEDLVKGFPSDGTIPAIEIDLTLQRIRNLYELMLMIRKEGKAPPAATVAVEKETAEATAETVEKKITKKEPRGGTPPASATTPVKTLSDKFKAKTTLHESFHQSLDKEPGTLAHVKPVTNLVTAIGINDRYTFIRELFNNDTVFFENTIKVLNNSSSFNDAYNFMVQHFNWDMDSEAVQLLLNIIRRKFIKERHE